MKDKDEPLYQGFFEGIILQNNDPEKRGRAKVWVPHISPTVYENWYQTKTDKAFSFPGDNFDTALTPDIMDALKEILPWAENALPMIGATGSGRFHAHSGHGTISDSNKRQETVPQDNYEITDTSVNADGIGGKPARRYETYNHKLHDAFDSQTHSNNRVNKYSYTYTPNSYSNSAKGSFSIPNVGTHVWVFFKEGHADAPVIFATATGSEDWAGLYDNNDYPGVYENWSSNDKSDYDIDTDTYRNKWVMNQKGGTIEIVNTDNRELLRMTHYSGSFKAFTNHTNIELAVEDDQKLVQNDQWLTVRGYKNSFVQKDWDNIIKGNHHKKVGKLDRASHLAWKELMSAVAEVKQLFDTARTSDQDEQWNSTMQKQEGPVIDLLTNQVYDGEYHTYNGPPFNPYYQTISPDFLYTGKSILEDPLNRELRKPLKIVKNGYGPCPLCNSLSTRLQSVPQLRNTWSSIGVPIVNSTGNYVSDGSTVSPTTYTASKKTTGATSGTLVPSALAWTDSYKYLPVGQFKLFDEDCPVCGGTGQSPSSMDGDFGSDRNKIKLIDMVKSTAKQLVDIERQLGKGGSEIIDIAKHKIETIGMVMNDFGSIRIDTKGKMYKDKIGILEKGVYESQKETPLIEYVHVDSLPGGDYTLNVCNKFNIQVGAGGVSMKSYGPVDIGGTITNLAGEQVNIASRNEVNVDGGKRLSIVADIISLRQRNREQILIDSSLGVANNLIVGGGAHIEGELSFHHMSAPVEINETEETTVYSKLLEGLSFSCQFNGFNKTDTGDQGSGIQNGAVGTITLKADSNDDKVRAYPHSHHMKTPPWKLFAENDDVRNAAKKNISTERNAPLPREWKKAADKVS